MGIEIDRDSFSPSDYSRFRERLSNCLGVLESLLKRDGFGVRPTTIGAELEVTLIDRCARPLPLNLEVLRETLDPRMTVELDRFNLECNLRYATLAGTPFAALRRELEDGHAELTRAAALHAGRVAMVGILPTVVAHDLSGDAMTDTSRYRALVAALRGARKGPARLEIAGDDPLVLDSANVTFEGAATSFQLHLSVAPANFAALFNAVQIATAPALALASNSPLFMGHRLWAETRVALFKQAVDERDSHSKSKGRLPRVGFGHGWLDEGALELFREAVEVFPPLLPILDSEDPVACFHSGGVPSLREIRLHQGTVWSWNRPVYDPAHSGHLRIELRALPSGPTISDMLANAAFLVGLGFGLLPEIEELKERLNFEDAHSNFYRAAQDGIDAELVWPDGAAGISAPGDRIQARELSTRLVDVARAGLRAQGVESSDADPLLDIISSRAQNGQTGAVWQRRSLDVFEQTGDKKDALERLVERYVVHSNADLPVHLWPIAP
jgi:gamma-glutamyl:cysteine ligase YbdK (ATP-grasp superfamily)